MGHHAPLTPGFVDVEHPIEDPPQIEGRTTGAVGLSLGFGQHQLQNIPLLIGQVRWIMGWGAHCERLFKCLKINRSLMY